MSVVVPGPYVRSHRRTSSVRAAAAGISGQRLGEPLIGRSPAVLARQPRTERAGAHDEPFDRQLQEDPVGDRDPRLVRLALGEQHLLLQLGDDRRERPRREWLALAQQCQRGGAGVTHECLAALDALGLQELCRAPTLRGDERLRARGVDDGGEIEGNDEHRPPHSQQAGQRAPFVQRCIQIADREPGQPLLQRQVDGRRIGGVQSDEIAGDVLDTASRHGEAVANEQSPPSLGDVEVTLHSLSSTKLAMAWASSTGMSPCTLCPASAKSLDADVREAPAQLGLVGVVDDGLRRASRERASRGR